MIKVLLVDDHDLVRSGIKKLLSDSADIEIVGEACSGVEALKLVEQLKPDVVLMDVNMPEMDGLEATKKIHFKYPNIKVLVLSVHEDDPYPSRVLQAGALGYITKGAATDEMLTAIRSVYAGRRYLSPSVAQKLALKHLEPDAENQQVLSEREMQILEMITSGVKVADIAERLYISPKTVNSYRYRIFEKLDVHSDVELTRYAIRNKLIEL